MEKDTEFAVRAIVIPGRLLGQKLTLVLGKHFVN